MDAALVFKICSSFVVLGWILLLVAPYGQYTQQIVKYGIVLVLSLVYLALITPTLAHFNPDAFSTLENVRTLFENDNALAAGWVHYLAFDLFVGAYIVKEGVSSVMSRWKYSVCLPFTFMFGPIGLLLFYLFKVSKR